MSRVEEKLSLVVCTRNRPGCVVRLLESVERGKLVPLEVLIVDGSEPSATGELARSLVALDNDRFRQIVVEDADRGLTRQRNVGIQAARGEWIAFLDDDCVPEEEYFDALTAALKRHPEAVGVGGLVSEAEWQPVGLADEGGGRERSGFHDGWIVVDGWRRREGRRWRLRRRLGLAPPFCPGRVPAEGHGWPVSYLAPGADDSQVDCFMGGASLWRRVLFERVGFSSWFEGYGLYEDQDFCLRAGRQGELWVARDAVVEHLHEPTARPNPFRYGRMVMVNGWRVWRQGNPEPSLRSRTAWWVVSLLLTLVRASNAVRGTERATAVREAAGRVWGGLVLLLRPPPLAEGAQAPLARVSEVDQRRSLD